MSRTRPAIRQGAPADAGAKGLEILFKFMYYVYILLQNNKQLYTGFTKNIRKRIGDHKKGLVKSTKKRLPVKLVHYEAHLKESDARRREKFLKTSEGKRLLKMQIRDLLKEIK